MTQGEMRGTGLKLGLDREQTSRVVSHAECCLGLDSERRMDEYASEVDGMAGP